MSVEIAMRLLQVTLIALRLQLRAGFVMGQLARINEVNEYGI